MGCWLSRSRCCWVSVVVLRPGKMPRTFTIVTVLEYLLFIPVISESHTPTNYHGILCHHPVS